MIKFTETESKLQLSDIQEIERYSNLTLPEMYANHLLKYNGGQCFPNIFDIKQGEKITSSNIDWFLAIYEGEYDNLKEYISIYKIENERLPKHILPIAHDPGGNLICISCAEGDKGCIFFWDHELENNLVSARDQNLFPLAKSLDEFFNLLY